jgi:hypothetical protein
MPWPTEKQNKKWSVSSSLLRYGKSPQNTFHTFINKSVGACLETITPHLTLVHCCQSFVVKSGRNKGQKITSIVLISLIDSALWFLNPELSCQLFPHEQSWWWFMQRTRNHKKLQGHCMQRKGKILLWPSRYEEDHRCDGILRCDTWKLCWKGVNRV